MVIQEAKKWAMLQRITAFYTVCKVTEGNPAQNDGRTTEADPAS
jgi:hypothetical protein